MKANIQFLLLNENLLEHPSLGLMAGGLAKGKPQNELTCPLSCRQYWTAACPGGILVVEEHITHVMYVPWGYLPEGRGAESNAVYPVIVPDTTSQVNLPTSRGAE